MKQFELTTKEIEILKAGLELLIPEVEFAPGDDEEIARALLERLKKTQDFSA